MSPRNPKTSESTDGPPLVAKPGFSGHPGDLGRERDDLRYVFGPVPSRRLGRSLGVDLVPFKTCSYDCIYCQLGKTTNKTVERQEWVSMEAVLDELKRKLASRPDYITLSGSGEPTLHSRLGELIEHIQAMSDVPVAVLTNGSLLWRKDVREELALADVVLPSLDAGNESLFNAVNRPHPEITFQRLLSGLEQFRGVFSGEYWLEVLLLAGHTAPIAHVKEIADCVRRIRPDRVQLNTALRPPAESFAVPVSKACLTELSHLFTPKAEIIAEYQRRKQGYDESAGEQAILELLRRRPCTEADVCAGLGMRSIEAAKHLASLEVSQQILSRKHGTSIYYRLTEPARSRPPCSSPSITRCKRASVGRLEERRSQRCTRTFPPH